VPSLYSMFNGAKSFNQSLEEWDVSSVVSTFRMFQDATAFNQPLGSWNTSSITETFGMFKGATAFNQPLGDWDVSNVEDMEFMFSYASAFNQPLGDWDVGSAHSMSGVFSGAVSFNQPLHNWNVSAVSNMRDTFNGASAFDQNLCSWGPRLYEEATRKRTCCGLFIRDLFEGTSCPSVVSPNFTTTPPGPFCHICLSDDTSSKVSSSESTANLNNTQYQAEGLSAGYKTSTDLVALMAILLLSFLMLPKT
jgi:surface protein